MLSDRVDRPEYNMTKYCSRSTLWQ